MIQQIFSISDNTAGSASSYMIEFAALFLSHSDRDVVSVSFQPPWAFLSLTQWFFAYNDFMQYYRKKFLLDFSPGHIYSRETNPLSRW